MLTYGLDGYEVKKMMLEKLDEEPDLFYYIKDKNINRLVELIIAGVADVIEENNKRIFDDYKRDLGRI